ncbi:MAG TPA: c-type cytochrome [Terriglobales bacterium]|nr:c-type cytochrome [Terriglobales bacterium]
MRAFIFGLIIGALLLAFAAYWYFTSGHAPAAVEDKPMPFERQLANGALHAHIDKEMPRSAPISADEATYVAGAQIYVQHCGICHGLPGTDQSSMAKAMFPKPPSLFHGKGVTDDPAGETYWKVANGIRLTGMPEFKHILNDTQIWQVSLLLANADKISDAVKQQLQPPPIAGGSMPPSMPGMSGKIPRTGTKAVVPPPTH